MTGIVGRDHGAVAGSGEQGPPLAGVEVVVVVAERIELVEPGVTGVLVLRAPAVVVWSHS